MVSFNKVFLVGNLTKDPELRYTPQGIAVATLRVASNTQFKDKTGETRKETCFINAVVWGQMAEVCNQYLEKGRAVLIEGRLQSRSWQGQDGKTRNTIEIRAQRVQFMPQAQRQGSQESKEIDLGDGPEPIAKLDNEEIGEVAQ